MLHGLKKFLEHKAYKMRVSSLQMTTQAGSGHPTSALSAADIVSAIFFYAMQFDPKNFNNPNNDRFILSKGHAAPILYAVYKELGLLSEQELLTYRQFGSPLEGHPTLRFTYAQAATGSLGMGLSIGAGMALSARMDKSDFRTYVLMGDSEITEGSVWEAVEIAGHYKLSNLIGIIDCNRLGQTTETIHGWHAQRYAQKFEAFGWKALVIDGHDMLQIVNALDKVRSNQDHPMVIIAKTIKGYGVEKVENKEGFHGKAFSKEELEQILPAMEARFASAAANGTSYQWQPNIPASVLKKIEKKDESISLKESHYKKGELVATRQAYGHAITQAGGACKEIVCLDAEVKNSTFAEIFEAKYPERFVQCFIAEQNMIGMAIGFTRCNKIPFCSTFACFLTRAHDQIRMAAIGTSPLRISGSHGGVSIGQDGPSQMGLEDIAMMSALPESTVLYPSDAVSTHALVEQMTHYSVGISYVRTTREKTPVIYDNDEQFPIGGCKVLYANKGDVALIAAAGITLHEAIKAREQLLKEGISVSIIDLYSVKPLDAATIEKIAVQAGDRIITVEDHYIQGGIGQSVAFALRNSAIEIHCLAVTQLPMSGKPEELLSWAGIDMHAIVKKVKEITKH
jgi:transketolase